MTDTKDEGGPAFPRTWTEGSNGEYWTTSSPGMSLRDWFAGQALQTTIRDRVGAYNSMKEAAGAAYLFADAMIAERKKGGAS